MSGDGAANGFWDLAVAATQDDPSRDNLEDKRSITLVAGGFVGGGIFVGQWDAADQLVFRRAAVSFDDGGDATTQLFDNCGTTSVSSCELHPTVLYAACAWPDGTLNSIIRSKDGGRNWSFCAATLADGGPFDLLAPTVGDQGKNWNNCISVHPKIPRVAALGWQAGVYLSFDLGSTWRRIADDSDHLHGDFHALQFSIETPESFGYLYVGSDGGVAKVNLDDLPGVNGPPIQSDFNMKLTTLQCYSFLDRQFDGSVDLSAQIPGIACAGLQDNGNVSARLWPTPGPQPWQHVDGGDGGYNISVLGGYLHNVNGMAMQATAPLSPDVQTAVIPITVPGPTNASGLVAAVTAAVTQPSLRNSGGQLLLGMASSSLANTVYGLYAKDGAKPPYEWQLIGSLPSDQPVSALASFDGNRVFAGTGKGKMYALDPGTGAVTEQGIKLPQPSPSSQMAGGAVTRIAGFDAGAMFAVLLGATEMPIGGAALLGAAAVQGYVLRLDDGSWTPAAGTGLPNEYLYGFCTVAAPNTEIVRGLMAATDDAVYLSRDDGASWRRASLGLPRRPHCADLRFVMDRAGDAHIVLGTFGRSMWIAPLP